MKTPLRPNRVVGARIKELREALEMPQGRLAVLVSLHICDISRVECGHRGLRVADVCRFARALQVQPGDILAPLDAA